MAIVLASAIALAKIAISVASSTLATKCFTSVLTLVFSSIKASFKLSNCSLMSPKNVSKKALVNFTGFFETSSSWISSTPRPQLSGRHFHEKLVSGR